MSTEDGTVTGGMDDEGGAVGLSDEMTIGWRFNNVPKRLV
jgi:hypothetical protein